MVFHNFLEVNFCKYIVCNYILSIKPKNSVEIVSGSPIIHGTNPNLMQNHYHLLWRPVCPHQLYIVNYHDQEVVKCFKAEICTTEQQPKVLNISQIYLI